MTAINSSRLFYEVQEVIYEGFVIKPQGKRKKGRLSKKINKVSLEWTIAEVDKLRVRFDWVTEKNNPSLLGQCSTITEFAIRLQYCPMKRLSSVHSSYKINLIRKRAAIMNETLYYYQTNPIEYFERCLKKEIDEFIPKIEN